MRKAVLLFGARFLDRRQGHFVDWLVQSGFRVSIFALPRSQWDLSGLEFEAGHFDIGWCTMRNKDMRALFIPEIVICCNWSVLPFACALKFLFGGKLMYDEEDYPEIMFTATKKWTRGHVMSALARLFKRLFVPYCDLVTCIKLKDHLCQRDLLKHNTNVVELDNYPTALWTSNGDGTDHGSGVAAEEPLTFVYLGKIVDRKGCRICGEAFAKATQQSPRFLGSELHFFAYEWGPPELTEWLKNQEGIFVHIGAPPAEIVAFLEHRRCVGLLLYEDSPYYAHIGTNSAKIYEYLAMGSAVIATPVGDLKRFITEHDIGFLVDGDLSTEELAELYVWISENPAELGRKRGNAKALMSRDSMRWESVWDRVIETGFFENDSRGVTK